MQFDVVGNVAMAVVVRPSLLRSTVCFSHVEEQWKRVYNEVETSAIAPIGFLAKREVVQFQGKGVYAVGFAGIGCELE